MKTLKILLTFLIFTASASFSQTNWSFDKSHSKIGFSVSHLVITDVDGKFNEFDGTIISPGEDFTDAKVNFSANIASIDTDNDKRDNHLKSDDFFNAEKFPTLTFKGKSFKKIAGKNYKLLGDLTIRDVTKEIELDVILNGTVVDGRGNTKAGFSLEGVINRFDYNLKWNAALENRWFSCW